MNDLLKDASYKKIKSNPTTKVEKIADALKEVESRGGLSSAQRKSLANTYSTPPQLYGLPKIHKNGTPFWPIVSSIDSPTYRLAEHLASILQPLVGTTASYVRDSGGFVTKLKAIDVEEEDMMVSFDVVSLFTRVPVSEAFWWLKICLQMMTPWGTWQPYCQLTLCLLPDCASPPPTSSLEVTFTSKLKVRPWVPPSHQLWPTSTCRTLSRGHWQQPHNYAEKDGSKLTTSVYRNPTHTARYLHYSSHHHPKVKSGIADCLYHRAERIC